MLRSLGSERAGRGGRRSARTSAWMRASSESAGASIAWWCATCSSRPEHELHLARVLAPRGEEAVVGEGGGGVVLAADDRLARADLLPQRRGRVEEEEVHLAAGGERAQHGEVAGRDPRQAEERDALGEGDERGLGSQPLARLLESLGGAGLVQSLPQPAPELGLPGGLGREVDLTARPAAHHLRAVERVAVEQLGEVAEGGEPAARGGRRRRGCRGGPQVAQPRLVEALADDLEQRPHRALR